MWEDSLLGKSRSQQNALSIFHEYQWSFHISSFVACWTNFHDGDHLLSTVTGVRNGHGGRRGSDLPGVVDEPSHHQTGHTRLALHHTFGVDSIHGGSFDRRCRVGFDDNVGDSYVESWPGRMGWSNRSVSCGHVGCGSTGSGSVGCHGSLGFRAAGFGGK